MQVLNLKRLYMEIGAGAPCLEVCDLSGTYFLPRRAFASLTAQANGVASRSAACTFEALPSYMHFSARTFPSVTVPHLHCTHPLPCPAPA